MRPEIHALMTQQHGLITRPQALRTGLSPEEIVRLVRSGTWSIVRRGVYTETATAEAATSTRRRRLLLDRAASLRIGADHVPSHDFAAHELGLDILDPRSEYTHVTRPGVVGAHLRHGVKHHLAPFRTSDLVLLDGRPVLNAARTALDIAREHGNPAGVVAVDSARRLGVTVDDLADVRSRMLCWPYSQVMDEAIELSDPDADSVLETLVRLALAELGHGRPETQFGLAAEGRQAWCDLRLGRQLFECDGGIKYVPEAEGGLARTSPQQVLWEEKQRQDWICGFKLGVSRVVWDDVFGRRRASFLRRAEREYQDTCDRFGTSIDDLAQYRPRHPRRRPPRRVD